jgi:2-deoxy-D-gluconate 3-dehydrogenase
MAKDSLCAIVTGSASGLGAATAEILARSGARLVINYSSSQKEAEATAELCRKAGAAEVLVAQGDVSKDDDCRRIVAAASGWGRLDILVNNAGTNIRKPPHELSLDEWRQVLDTNLTSAFMASHAVHPIMKRQGGGKIINIGSMMSLFGASFAPAYAASKGGIVQFTKACAAAWALDNIQVNAVLPGWIDTELTQRARREVEGLHDNVLRRTPAKRWGTGADMAGVAVFLASPASDFVTGSAIPVDGGYSIQG